MKPVQIMMCLVRAAGHSGTDLQNADLRGANLAGADLRDANLWRANMTGASLTGAGVGNANFAHTNLAGVDLSWCTLHLASIGGANLIGAIHTGRIAPMLACELSRVGAPWGCVWYAWRESQFADPPARYDYWVGLAKEYIRDYPEFNSY